MCTLQLGWMWPLLLTVLYSDMQRFCCLVTGTVQGFPNYCSLAKECQWAEHHTNLPKRGVGTLSSISAFTHKRAPMSGLQLVDALEANNLTITYNRINSGFQVESWLHTTLWIAPCHHEDGVAHGAHHISYVCLHKDALYYTTFLTSNMHSAHIPHFTDSQTNYQRTWSHSLAIITPRVHARGG